MKLKQFLKEADKIAKICNEHSYMDKDYCMNEKGHICPYSEIGGCVFSTEWDILPCEILKRI